MSHNISKGTLDLSDKKKALFKRLQKEAATRLAQQQEAFSVSQLSVPCRLDLSTYPLSLSQERLWWLEQLTPGDPDLQVICALQLNGPLDSAVLHQALQALIQRHELLRAGFVNQHGAPVQIIKSTLPARLVLLNVAHPEAVVAQLLAPCQPHTFDLANGPLFNVTLAQLAEAEHALVFSSHALLADYSTLVLLCQELMALYSQAITGQSADLPELTLCYADYADWQRQYLQGASLEAQQVYWKQQLAGATLSLNLPSDAQQPAVQAPRQASSTFELDRRLVQQTQAFCTQEGIELPDLLFTTFALLLSQYTSQTDILPGFLSLHRSPELVPLVGDFANLLPIRVQISEGLTGQTLLNQVQQTLRAATSHQELPFAQLVAAVYPRHDLTRVPLVQASLTFHHHPSFQRLPVGLSVSYLPCASSLSLQDLVLQFYASEQSLHLTITYNGNLFTAAKIVHFQQNYCQLLQSFLHQPAQPLSMLSCLTPVEQLCLLRDWNAATLAQPFASSQCIHHLFEQQAQRTPLAIALSDGSQQRTYEQLNSQANQLACLLQHRGIGPEDLVGICLPRSFDLVVGLLAILKAGAAYVPLDPAYPRERLVFTAQDARLAIILTTNELVSQLALPAHLALCLDVPERAYAESSANLMQAMNNEHLAYVIYTSGSTGQPKGVCISHRSAVIFLTWARQQFSDEELAGVLFGTSICFDLSIFELFAPLSWGGKVILASTVLDLPSLAAKEQITLLNTVPSAAAALLANATLPAGLRTINLAGEALTRDLVQALYQQPGVQRVCNLYGPTEDTTYSTWVALDAQEQGAVPIGRPLENTQAYIVDSSLQPVPLGVAGELYLGGDGQARGYLNRPDLTAERFVPNPFSSVPGQRLYKTGDLARYRFDGTIEYLGRLDHQVKIRGFRIELGEIEARLRQHPAVMDTVVVAWGEPTGEKRLVAYIVPQPPDVPDASVLRSYLQELLPVYMLPSFFFVLNELPRTVNGKVDRKALPTPDPTRVSLSALPRNLSQGKREQWLALLWQEVLQLPTVGRTDDFFAIGGDSLRAMQLLARLQRDFQVQISLADLFASPTIVWLADRLRSAAFQPAFEPIVPARLNDQALAFGQQRLWFANQLEAGTAMFNVPLILALTGSLNRQALYQALYEIIRRHQSLRTTIRVSRGRPYLHIDALVAPALTMVDLPLSLESETLAFAEICHCPEVLSEMQAEVQRPFDLATGPLLRIRLLRVLEDCHILMLTMHHIIIDGWSLNLLTQELSLLYNAFLTGRPSPLPEISLQYEHFVAWQHTHQVAHFATGLAYWKERFTPLPSPLSLSTDFARPAVQTFAGTACRFQIPHTRTRQIQEFSRQEGVTLFMTLFAAFLLLLSRSSGQEDLVVGTPVANRSRPELECLVGLFMNTLALRTDLSGNPTGRELLHRVRAVTLDAYSHQEVPFEHVLDAVQIRRDPTRSPLFQVFFALQNTPSVPLNLEGLSAQSIEILPSHSEYDLTFVLEENPQGLGLTIEYNTCLFELATIERLHTHYLTFLQGLCTQPETHIQALSLLTDSEHTRLVYAWNQTKAAFPAESCLHELVAEQARRTPSAIAIEDGVRTLSYQELDQLTNQLAHALRRRGVGPESLVGICLERSLEQMLGLLAILKAGGAYVPLDAASPAERLNAMLASAQISLVLTQESLCELLSNPERTLICLDTDQSYLMETATHPPTSAVIATNLACVLYTSGSTGSPKGVLIYHRNVVNHSTAIARHYGIGPTDRILQFNSLCFDIAVEEIFPTWLNGATLVLQPVELLATFDLFQTWLQEHRITVANLPTAYWHLWTRGLMHHFRPLPERLRLVIVGGEEAQPELWRQWQTLVGNAVVLLNAYGPTEATVTAILEDVQLATSDTHGQVLAYEKVPIGRPLTNMRGYILDTTLQPVPVGVRGELYLAGEGVARGYLGLAALTAECFLPDPFTEQAGSRMYRTGDRAYYRADGQMVYAGRLDQQMKLRGFRIEPGEIEQVLREQPTIQEAVVLLREDVPGNPQIVAYVQVDAAFTLSSIQIAIKRLLPIYMLPTAIINVETFPLTSNGKIDRKRLPPPAYFQQAEHGEHPISDSPQGSVEETLAGIWQTVLGIPSVERTENFFEIGGHSLLAMQVLAAVREEFQNLLTIREFFAAPTLMGLAGLIEARLLLGQPGTESTLPALVPVARTGDFPLSFAQQRLWFLDQLEGSSATYNIPVALQLTGPLNLPVFQQSLRELVRRHEVLRTTFMKVQQMPVQCIHLLPLVALQVIEIPALDFLQEQAAILQEVQAEVQRSFDLTTGPLLRLRLLRLNQQKHILIFTMHHIISDGWSIGIMARELSSLYNAFLAGHSSPLPELSIQYADFAVWQRAYLQGPRLDAHLAYWKQQLVGAPPLDLPTDHPRQVSSTTPGSSTSQQWSIAFTQQLLTLSQEEGVTPFMTLLAGFLALLAYSSGQEDITIGTPIANRPHPDLEQLIGFFVNTLVLRVDLSGNPTGRELLHRVREVTLDAYEHQDVPFEQIVEAVRPKRELGRSPLFQILFVFQNVPLPDLSLTDLTVESFGTDTSTAKFDLSVGLEMHEQGLEVGTEYNTQLFELATIQQFHTQYRVLLEQFTTHLEWKLSDFYQVLSEHRSKELEPPCL
ncbi:MAG: amino acid adenylation domain-containing protein [Ktedonobacteraceae bacterium]